MLIVTDIFVTAVSPKYDFVTQSISDLGLGPFGWLQSIAFFIFGLATLVACLSVFTFEPKLFLELSAFFTFALLAGYLSFITPMGLGVREGIIILGLTKLTSIATAGFLSIFSRIVLIISELTFLAIVLGFEISTKIKNK